MLRRVVAMALVGSVPLWHQDALCQNVSDGSSILDEYYALVSSQEASQPDSPADPSFIPSRPTSRDQSWGHLNRPGARHHSQSDWRLQDGRERRLRPSEPATAYASPAEVGLSNAPIHGAFASHTHASRVSDGPNFSVGSLELTLTYNTSLDYSDNFFHSSFDKLEALSFTAGTVLTGQWHLTDSQSLDFQVGAGWDYWIDGPGGDIETGHSDFTIAPGSSIDYVFHIGRAISLRVYDQFEIRRNQSRNQFSLDAVTISDQWMNTAGASLHWDINDRTNAEIGYQNGRRRAFDDRFSSIDYKWHSASARLALTDAGSYEMGVDASASWADYEDPSRNDSDSYSVGIFARLPLTDYTEIHWLAGIEDWNFQGSDRLPATDHQGFFGTLELSNQLNDVFRHSLSIARHSSLSEFSDYTIYEQLRYGFEYRILEGTRLNGAASFRRSSERGSGRSERRNSFHGELGIHQTLTPYVSVGAHASYSDHDSNLNDRSYSEQRGQAWLSWQINDRLSLTGSYEHWRSDGNVQFAENRALIGASFAF